MKLPALRTVLIMIAALANVVSFSAAVPRRVVLVEELIRVQAMERKTVVVFPLAQQGAEVEVRFGAKLAGEGVQVLVYESGVPQPVAASKYETSGLLRVPVAKDREYRIDVENRRQRLGFGLVDMEVALVFGARAEQPLPQPEARTLDPKRRYFTIAASLTLFAMILAYSAVRLGPPIAQRIRGER